MSARDIGGMLERFNATGGRGDVLSISREDAARLHELPLEIYGPIFHALLGWFLTGEETHLDDPRDRAMLAGFKEHQLGNAARRGKFLNDQKEKSDKAVQARMNRTHGTPTDNPRDTQVKDKDKAEDKDEVRKSLSSADGADRGGLTPPVCPSLSAAEAKKTLAPIPGKYYFARKRGPPRASTGRGPFRHARPPYPGCHARIRRRVERFSLCAADWASRRRGAFLRLPWRVLVDSAYHAASIS